VYPIIDHYYEPLFSPKRFQRPPGMTRSLPALDLNEKEQLEILNRFHYNEELLSLPIESQGRLRFHYHNPMFGTGDAEYLYSMLRLYKPKRIIEIGSGQSTLMALQAVAENRKEDAGCSCEITCIEPYEAPFLDDTGVIVLRERVEGLDGGVFAKLEAGDILFIDSSHMIRPQGDVLFEYLQILPTLKPGVLVHAHDIFTPRDYPADYGVHPTRFNCTTRFWNEQYLLEAFLAFNREYKVIGALNYLKHNHFQRIAAKCPILAQEPQVEPTSFWIMKV
jgi:predicted O-methyltransferase YrrM